MPDKKSDIADPGLLGLMTGGIAHDLNNFLSPILLGVQTLQRNDPDDKTKRILSMIEQSSRKATDLVRHLMEYSRRFRSSTERCSVSHALSMVESFNERKEGKLISVLMESGFETSELCIDPLLFAPILGAVLSNAVDATAANTGIEVEMYRLLVNDEYKRQHRTARNGDYACFLVRDSGEGIAEEHLKHVFDPFFTVNRDALHAGLGLFFVHTIIKQCEGFLDIESEPGKGTTVTLCVPLVT
jgi:signal transduction histidine kinase